MLYDNACPLLFVIILSTHSVQCCYNIETSPLIYTLNYGNSNTGLKIVKLNSAKNAISHMLLYVMSLVEFFKCKLVFMTSFSPHAQNLEF